MINKSWLTFPAILCVWLTLLNCPSGQCEAREIECVWSPLPGKLENGLLAERVDLWRQGRMMYMIDAENEYLLSGFESRPGIHPWQGEHVGKWLHAATLAYEQTGDKRLLDEMESTVTRLIATQDADGYMGTYALRDRFMSKPQNISIIDVADDVGTPEQRKTGQGGWDTWTLRYNLYGLLTYEQYHPDPRVLTACREMADLLMEYYGEDKYDLTKYGTRQGISATTLLESIVMLYQRTKDERYLDFAEHIVVMSENNPRLRLMGTMLDNGSVVEPGDGKAYQLMANLLGYLRLYECTGKEQYLKTVQTAWAKIRANHLLVTGGPWGMKKDYNGNRECFAYPKDFDPAHADVETCSTTTWIQLNLHLLELTGQAKYAMEAERALFNALLAAQYREGIDWCYYTGANQTSQPFEAKITCCASSGPRALEMFSHYRVGTTGNTVSFATLVPGTVDLPAAFGNARIKVSGNYPVSPVTEIQFEETGDEPFAIEFRCPDGARLESVSVNGKEVSASENEREFHSLSREWKRGDRVVISFEYLLASHFETSSPGKRWVAFSYGPWALAQVQRTGDELVEPFLNEDLPSRSAAGCLEAITVEQGELPQFRIMGTGIVLQPYAAACDRDAGPRTYFQFAGNTEKSSARKTNIVFFLVDDLGWSDLGCYGSSFYDTPNIDKLAAEGLRFTDAYATCHVCSPSRASILTGKYPARLKLTDWLPGRKDYPFQQLQNAPILQALPLAETTLAEALKQGGYRTGMFGKWHLGEAEAGPLKQGFDVQVPQNWFKGWPKAGYHFPFDLDGLDGEADDYLTDRLTDEALKYIEDNRDKPFFLYLAHFAVHDPIQGRADLVDKYQQKRAGPAAAEKPFILEGNPDSRASFTKAQLDRMIESDEYKGYRVLRNRMVKIKQQQDNPEFAAMVESVDESLGRLIAKLQELGLDDDTIIIFTSDNGGMAAANFGRPDRVINPASLDKAYSTSNLPLRGAKGWLYEGGIRVPLIIKWPGMTVPGSVSGEPVTGTDFYPTILDMTGLPRKPGQHMDGVSLTPLFDGEHDIGRDAIYWYFPHYSNHGMQSPGAAVRCGKYKLLEYFENGTVQLFDLESDPGEHNDLAGKRPEVVNQLQLKLHQWQEAVGAERMPPNPEFEP